MTSKIDQNSIKNRSKKRFEKITDFDRKNNPKATPEWAPKSSNNRSWGQLGPQEGPKRIQQGSRDRIWMIFDRFCIDLGCFFLLILVGFFGLPAGLQNILKQVSIFCVAQVIREHYFKIIPQPYNLTHDLTNLEQLKDA